MGLCCCKENRQDGEDTYAPPVASTAASVSSVEPRGHMPKVVDSVIVDHLVLEMLTLIASFVDK